ncbi:L,D-transpeptidase family protein [Sphingomonas naphthae]|uniref:L,D-transpeptidase family protein n=1 Tax=Sphingomonas naphthae TaxID=1813468 RepID=A0ABY7TQS9_9SPHN|nr:L,D-transpeptidase family protein [Sphingomonas naphthae]WCT75383.1 L,D-transpeptidase family protein [Sphingomonas naphthae]
MGGATIAAQPQAASPEILSLQVQLDRLGFGPGVIDGKKGMSLAGALRGFQKANDLKVTGEPDPATIDAIKAKGAVPGVIEVTLTAAMLAGPFHAIPKKEGDQAKLPALGYANAMEKLGEMFHTTPAALIALNSPQTRVGVGAKIKVPNVLAAERNYDPELKPDWRQTLDMLNVSSAQPKAAKIVVDKSDGVLMVYDEGDKLIAQFPATMGSGHDPLPIGSWKINGASYNPTFHYNPKLFWDASSSDKKALLPPGPNGPVGVVWLDLSKEHYGIHGTPKPENIGRTESHGCIRLTNWDAARLAMMVKPGTPAIFQP